MAPVTLTIEVPEDLAQEANELGLLRSETLVKLLREEVDQAVMNLVNAEIQAYRGAKAAGKKTPSSQK